ncbi:MAG TPA: hypothetical protein VEB00_09605 [Clostridia bacterium]|nr:hypothetical protein [Clostridia bacterium]
MKSFFWSLIFLFCAWSLFFIGKGADNIDIMSERYKRALDAGANAAASYRAYNSRDMLLNQGTGYGVGLEDSGNVAVDKEEAVKWFYRLFFRNLSINDTDKQKELKRFIPMKAVICYDRLMIADADDNWYSYDSAGEKEYVIQYRGKSYMFTLSDQIYDIHNGIWVRAGDIGLESKDRKALLTQYITSELNSFLANRANKESGNDYKIVFSLDDAIYDKLSGINGVNFIVFSEGMPIPTLKPFKRGRFFAYGVGGSEIRR